MPTGYETRVNYQQTRAESRLYNSSSVKDVMLCKPLTERETGMNFFGTRKRRAEGHRSSNLRNPMLGTPRIDKVSILLHS